MHKEGPVLAHVRAAFKRTKETAFKETASLPHSIPNLTPFYDELFSVADNPASVLQKEHLENSFPLSSLRTIHQEYSRTSKERVELVLDEGWKGYMRGQSDGSVHVAVCQWIGDQWKSIEYVYNTNTDGETMALRYLHEIKGESRNQQTHQDLVVHIDQGGEVSRLAVRDYRPDVSRAAVMTPDGALNTYPPEPSSPVMPEAESPAQPRELQMLQRIFGELQPEIIAQWADRSKREDAKLSHDSLESYFAIAEPRERLQAMINARQTTESENDGEWTRTLTRNSSTSLEMKLSRNGAAEDAEEVTVTYKKNKEFASINGIYEQVKIACNTNGQKHMANLILSEHKNSANSIGLQYSEGGTDIRISAGFDNWQIGSFPRLYSSFVLLYKDSKLMHSPEFAELPIINYSPPYIPPRVSLGERIKGVLFRDKTR